MTYYSTFEKCMLAFIVVVGVVSYAAALMA
jgi:hypothetical protein